MAEILDDADKFCYIKLTDKDKPDFDCTDKKGKDSHGLQDFIKKRALKNHKAQSWYNIHYNIQERIGVM